MGRGISYKFHDFFCTYINIRINIWFTFRIDKLWLPFIHVIRRSALYRYFKACGVYVVRVATFSPVTCEASAGI